MSDTNGELSELAATHRPDVSHAPGVQLSAEDAMLAAAEASALLSALGRAQERRYGFRVGAFGFLVAPQTHSEVVLSPNICPLPQSPRWLLGLVNLRGNLVPVFDMHALCGFEAADVRAQATVLVIDSGENAVGMPIDALPTALGNLRPARGAPSLPDVLSESVSEFTSDSGDMWLELNHRQFFSTIIKTNGLVTRRT